MHEKEVEVLKNRFARVSDNTEAKISFLLVLQPLRVTGTLKSNIKVRRIEELITDERGSRLLHKFFMSAS